MATCGRRGRGGRATLLFSSGLSGPMVRAVRVILERAVRFLGRGVEFPDMP